MRCVSCGFENPPDFNFCGRCGKELAGLAAVTTQEAERRQLTVMFCDLVGSTELAQRLDPEDWREILRSYQRLCEKAVQQYDGHLAQYLGDGVLVYFGYPHAHEDDARRAAHAGLSIAREIQQLSAHWQLRRNLRLAVRVGIHTGLVVAGEVGGVEKHEQLALGSTPNIAARLQSLAAENTVVISAATHQLLSGYFICESLGAPLLKGVASPLEIYRVQEESGVLSRLEVAHQLTPLVGRRQELAELLAQWQQARAGAGRIVLLNGEAGIGKSRLRHEFENHLAREPHDYLRCRCSPYHQQNGVFYPIINMLTRRLKLSRADAAVNQLTKIERLLTACHLTLSETVPVFAGLLAVPLDGRYPPLNLNLELYKQKIRDTVVNFLQALALQQPVCLVVDDLHWVDTATLELLEYLLPNIATSRLLGVFSFRPSFQPSWRSLSPLVEIRLAPLSRDETATMIKNITRDQMLPPEIVTQLVNRADGVPLFVEELTRLALESGQLHAPSSGDAPASIPPALYDYLLARLDHLGAAKEVAQLAATIGREFDYALLRAVSPLEETALHNALHRLLSAGLLYSEGEKFLFKHALIRDAAYHSLLKSKRQEYHQLIAQVLTTQFHDTVASDPGLVAYHQTRV